MIRRLKERLTKKNKGAKGVKVTSTKASNAARRLERYAEAAGLAQAGLQDVAQEIIRQEIQEKAKILVVGRGDGYSRALADYAVHLSKRMGYEIVALSIGQLPDESYHGQSPPTDEALAKLRSRAAEEVQLLTKLAAENGVPFRHVVKHGPPGQCVRETIREVSRLKFVIVDEDPACEMELKTSIPVFSYCGPK